MQNLRAHYDAKPKCLQTPQSSDGSSEVSQATKSAPTAASPAPKSAEQSCSHGCATAQGFGVGGGREADSLGTYAKYITPPPDDLSKDSPDDPSKGSPKDSSKDSPDDPSKGSPKDSSKDSPKDSSKGSSKGSSKDSSKIAEKSRAMRAERFSLLSSARDVLFGHARDQGYQYASKMHRTTGCHFLSRGSVSVLKSTEYDRAFYAGLTTCGSVWSCPVCAAKVQERRREEVAQAIEWAYEQGLQPMMVTLTFPHRRWHKVEDLLSQQAVALQKLRAGAPWKRVKDAMGFRGMIRSLEVTYGKNGWHPHTHELWFVDPSVDAEKARDVISARWRKSCEKAGLLDSGDVGFDAHAVDVKGWCGASAYMAKQDDSTNWGVDREIAKGTAKKGKGTHPFGLLQLLQDTGEDEYRRAFLEYSMAIKGRRQIHWSRGLKNEVGLNDQTDEELAAEQREEASVLGQLEPDDWKLIRNQNAQAQVLDLAETSGWQAIRDLVDSFDTDHKERQPQIEQVKKGQEAESVVDEAQSRAERRASALRSLRAMSAGMSQSMQGELTADDGTIMAPVESKKMPDIG